MKESKESKQVSDLMTKVLELLNDKNAIHCYITLLSVALYYEDKIIKHTPQGKETQNENKTKRYRRTGF